MKSIFSLLLVLFLTATHLCGYEHAGFSVDDSRISIAHKYIVPEFINQQLDEINHLPLSPEILDFFHTVPILLINDEKGSYDGYYYDERKNLKETDPNLWASIPLKSVVININRFTQITDHLSDTALLYSLLWAFADQKLSDNDDIFKYAQEADAKNYYYYNWEESYDQYGAAFFADSSIAFLLNKQDTLFHGRVSIGLHQPNYYLCLKEIFGPKSDSYHRPSTMELVEDRVTETTKSTYEATKKKCEDGLHTAQQCEQLEERILGKFTLLLSRSFKEIENSTSPNSY